MPKKRFSSEQIIAKLRQIEVHNLARNRVFHADPRCRQTRPAAILFVPFPASHLSRDLDCEPRLELWRVDPVGGGGLADDLHRRIGRSHCPGAGVHDAPDHAVLAHGRGPCRQLRSAPADACRAALSAGGVSRLDLVHLLWPCDALAPACLHLPGRLRRRLQRAGLAVAGGRDGPPFRPAGGDCAQRRPGARRPHRGSSGRVLSGWHKSAPMAGSQA
jgi:hypothetical protein